ncbi:hypothetical protein [Natrinema versiforme]|uniref:Uncharacterized protein n=1 Tax=Natrinema versiforme JCM 10478 TaxID=1227496 RepID=L9YBG7_9EURY|nr:hypothetical protein [Natrinema versiforme]ELY71405.1 hypothetical protein C489_00516 [Natrinema versiforme JCM 10478]
MTSDSRLPATTGRAIALAAGISALALALAEPLVAGGVLVGIGLSATVGLSAGSYHRVAVASALLPIVVLGGVAVIGPAGAPIAALSALVGVVLGLAAGGVLAGEPTPIALLRAGAAALCSAVVAGGAALVAVWIDTLGGVGPALAAVPLLTGDGPSGLFLALVAAVVAIAAALFLVPPAAFTVPSRRDTYDRTRNALTRAAGVATVLAIVVLAVLTVLSVFVPPLEWLVDVIAGSVVVRGSIAAVTVVAAVVAVSATAIRATWLQTDGRRNGAVAIIVGAVSGVGLAFAGVWSLGSVETNVVAVAFGALAIVLGAGWLAAWLYQGAVLRGDAPTPSTVLAGSLAAGGAIAGGTVDTVLLDLETVRVGVATFVPIAAALFAYDVGRYGRTLASEIGHEASRRPQLVRLGWSGAMAGAGVLVAALGLAGAAVLAPALSVPATAGVIGALVAVGGGTWLLVR